MNVIMILAVTYQQCQKRIHKRWCRKKYRVGMLSSFFFCIQESSGPWWDSSDFWSIFDFHSKLGSLGLVCCFWWFFFNGFFCPRYINSSPSFTTTTTTTIWENIFLELFPSIEHAKISKVLLKKTRDHLAHLRDSPYSLSSLEFSGILDVTH